MDSNRQWRLIIAVISILFAISYFLRVYPQINGSVFAPSFHPVQDWPRQYIVTHGEIGSIQNPLTQFSAWPGENSAAKSDFASILMATVTIIMGADSKAAGLAAVDHLIVHGMIILPIMGLFAYTFSSKNIPESISPYKIGTAVAFGLFPFGIFVLKLKDAYRPVLWAYIMVGLAIFTLIQIHDRRRFLILTLLLTFIFSSYHTLAITGLIYIGGIPLGALVLKRIFRIDRSNRRLKTDILIPIIVVALFFLIGTTLNYRFNELVKLPVKLLFTTGGGGVFQTSQQSFYQAIINLTSPRKISKIISRLAGVGLVFLYIETRIRRFWKGNNEFLYSEYELVIISGIIISGIYFVLMYTYGGFGQAISRTMFIGVFFLLLIIGVLLVDDSPSVQTACTFCVIIIVVGSISGVVTTPTWSQTEITQQEEAAITFVGHQTKDTTYIFSDTRLGPPLYYYEKKALTWISLDSIGTSTSNAIYNCSSGQNGHQAIKQVMRKQTFNSQTHPEDYVALFSTRFRSLGASVWYINQDVCSTFPRKYDHFLERIYSSGEGRVYRSS